MHSFGICMPHLHTIALHISPSAGASVGSAAREPENGCKTISQNHLQAIATGETVQMKRNDRELALFPCG